MALNLTTVAKGKGISESPGEHVFFVQISVVEQLKGRGILAVSYFAATLSRVYDAFIVDGYNDV